MMFAPYSHKKSAIAAPMPFWYGQLISKIAAFFIQLDRRAPDSHKTSSLGPTMQGLNRLEHQLSDRHSNRAFLCAWLGALHFGTICGAGRCEVSKASLSPDSKLGSPEHALAHITCF